MVESEVVLPRRVVPQPTPTLYEGGDCSACALAGLIGKDPQWVYDHIYEKVAAPSWPEMWSYLHKMEMEGHLDRSITAVPYWPPIAAHRTFGDTAVAQGSEWFQYVRMAIDAGYYGLMQYNMEGGGPWSQPDHFVLVVGARMKWIPLEKFPNAKKGETSLLISCSSTKTPPEFWITVEELLKTKGGFNLFLARPV